MVSPVVRRILSDGGVEPSTLKGTGPGGSITRRDAERAVAQGPTEEVVLPLSNGRRRMGQHMSVSSQGTPHGFVAVEVDGAIFGELDALVDNSGFDRQTTAFATCGKWRAPTGQFKRWVRT